MIDATPHENAVAALRQAASTMTVLEFQAALFTEDSDLKKALVAQGYDVEDFVPVDDDGDDKREMQVYNITNADGDLIPVFEVYRDEALDVVGKTEGAAFDAIEKDFKGKAAAKTDDERLDADISMLGHIEDLDHENPVSLTATFLVIAETSAPEHGGFHKPADHAILYVPE